MVRGGVLAVGRPGAARRAALLGAVALLVGCGSNSIVTSARDLDLPTSVILGCVAGQGAQTAVAPMAACQDVASATHRLLAFVLQRVRGEIAVLDASGARFLDLNPKTPGFGFIPVGRLPSDLDRSADGCWLGVSNGGSCTVSVVDVGSALGGVPAAAGGAVVRELTVNTPSGPLRARPSAIVFAQVDGASPTSMCSAVPPTAYVTYPGCDLVAHVELATGNILDSVFIRSGSLIEAGGTNPSCPIECAGQLGASPPVSSPAAPAVAATQPVALALVRDVDRLFVGLDGISALGVVEVGPTTGALGAGATIPLEGTTPGVRRLRATPPLFADHASAGERFLYVLARDGTTRVVSAQRRVECDTQVDPRSLPAGEVLQGDVALRGCVPVGSRPRRATAQGPGLALPSAGVIQDVTFLVLDGDPSTPGIQPNPDDSLTSPTRLEGIYGYAVSTTGTISAISLQDARPLSPTADRLLAHQLRSSNDPRVVLVDPAQGLTSEQQRNLQQLSTNRTVGQPRIFSGDPPTTTLLTQPVLGGPTLYLNGPLQTSVQFPDLGAVRTERWSFVYEGALPGTTSNTGVVAVDGSGATVVDDPGALFCSRGVLAGDDVVLLGCTQDSDCGTNYVCRREATVSSTAGNTITGLCFPDGQQAQLAATCRPLLLVPRTYRVTQATSGRLVIVEIPQLDGDGQQVSCTGVGPSASATLGGVAGSVGCAAGYTCSAQRCVRAPLPTPECFPAPTRYEARAAGAFVGSGQLSPFFHRVQIDPGTSECAIDAAASPLLTGRVPLTAPACAGDTINPCVEPVPAGLTGYSTMVRLSNPVFTLRFLIPTSPVAESTTVAFTVGGGYLFYSSSVTAALPFGAAGGPDGRVYIVDAADQTSSGGSRGQLVRVDGTTLLFDTNFTVR
jgi:hypothetical protein